MNGTAINTHATVVIADNNEYAKNRQCRFQVANCNVIMVNRL